MSRKIGPSIWTQWTWRSTMYLAMFALHLVLTAVAVPAHHALAFVFVVFAFAVLPVVIPRKWFPTSGEYHAMSPKEQVVNMLSCSGLVTAAVAVIHREFVIAVVATASVVVMTILFRRRKW